jgi:hypothetical protein
MQRTLREVRAWLFGAIGVGLCIAAIVMLYDPLSTIVSTGSVPESTHRPLSIAGVMLIAGIGFLQKAVKSYRREKAYEEIENLGEPWMVRKAWQSPTLAYEAGSGHPIWATVLLSIGGFAAGWFIWNEIIQATTPKWPVLLLLLLPLFGVLLAYQSYKAYKQRQRFGTSEMELETMPARLGTRMLAEVRARLPRSEFPEHGVQIQLSCYRRTVHRETRTDSDGDRKTKLKEKKRLLWRGEKQMRARTYNDDQACIPVSFEIPAELPESTAKKRLKKYLARTGKADTIWVVNVHAEVPGVDYDAEFEIPVYEAEENDQDTASASTKSDMADAAMGLDSAGDGASEKVMWDLERDEEALSVGTGEDEAASDDPYAEYEVKPDLDAPISKNISVERLGGQGIRVHMRPDRSLKGIGTMALMIALGVGLFFASSIFFSQNILGGIGSLVCGVGCLAIAWGIWYQEVMISVSDGEIDVQAKGGTGTSGRFPATEVEDIKVLISGGESSSNYQIAVQRRSSGEGLGSDTAEGVMGTMGQVFGKKAQGQLKEKMVEAKNRVAHFGGLHNKIEADWLAQQLRDAVEAEKRYA